MHILGITGGIGSGKTTVTNIFSLMGFPCYIADAEGKRVTENSSIIREKLITLFGNELYAGGKLNRSLLASYIFTNKEMLTQVNAIIHPEIQKDFFSWVEVNKDNKFLVLESAILFESGFSRFVDKTITVYTPLEDRIERTMKRDSLTREDVLKRMNNQMPDEQKRELSDFTIVNDNRHSLIQQVLFLVNKL